MEKHPPAPPAKPHPAARATQGIGPQALNPSTANGWQASLRLGFRPGPGRTLLAERHHRGPLRVQRTFHPEGGVCHCYLLHPPGGLVGGDQLKIEVQVASQAHALITTPGASKFYRSAGDRAEQQQTLRVEEGGILEWFPQENILFPGTNARLSTRIQLAVGARFIGWECLVLGRPANQETFDHGCLEARLELYQDQHPLLLERLAIGQHPSPAAACARDHPSALRGYPLSANFLASPVSPEGLEVARRALPELEDELCAFTLVDGILVGRYLGRQAERARRCFIPVWQALRPWLLGCEAHLPRIWST